MKDNITKNLDKLYFKFLKYVKEEIADSLISVIAKNGIVSSITYAIVSDDVNSVALMCEVIKGLDFFEKSIKEDIIMLIMSSLRSADILKIILELRDRICPLSKDNEFNEEMVSCLYRHAFKYPQNKDICLATFKKYRHIKNTLFKPFVYSFDNPDMIVDYLTKDEEVKNFVIESCVCCGSFKTLKKVLKYYKSSDIVMSKFNPTILYENSRDFDLTIEQNKFYLLNDICINSKWDFLPSLFDKKLIKSSDFVHFRFSLYQSLLNIQFIKPLIYYMKKYNFELELLKDNNAEMLKCSEEIKQEFVDNDMMKDVNFVIIDIQDKHCDEFIASLFEAYTHNQFEIIKRKLTSVNANFNPRFKNELKYALELVENKQLNWNDELTQKFLDFNKMCMDYSYQSEIMNDIVLEYNSFITIYKSFNEFICLRYLNKIKTSMLKITDEILMDIYSVVYKNYNGMYKELLEKVKKTLKLDTKEDWVLSENPTLEELFINLYLNSSYKQTPDDTSLIYYVKQTLEKKKFDKILEEVNCAICYSVPIEEIIKILRIKNIL
jgi:hypothetical protein